MYPIVTLNKGVLMNESIEFWKKLSEQQARMLELLKLRVRELESKPAVKEERILLQRTVTP